MGLAPVRSGMSVALASLVLWGADAFLAPVSAQGRLDARYTASLSGIPIGKGAWVIEIAETQFTAAASGATSGLLRLFAHGQGTGASRGVMVAGKPVPASFAASITSNKKTEDIRITLGSGNVRDFAIDPPPPPHPEHVPLTDAHRHGVDDPMTAALFRVPGNGNPLIPQACERTSPVFDGRIRYNLKFAYKRMEHVKSEKGYEGPVVVCAVYFVPLAGYDPARSAIKYLASQRDMEVWLAPIGTTRVLVPYRISVPTPVGLGILEATQFVSMSAPQAAAAKTR